MAATMQGVRLPGDRTVAHVSVPVPTPGHGQVLLRVRASSICGGRRGRARVLELLVRWDLHPERIVTDRFTLSEADAAYRLADAGQSGKISIVMAD